MGIPLGILIKPRMLGLVMKDDLKRCSQNKSSDRFSVRLLGLENISLLKRASITLPGLLILLTLTACGKEASSPSKSLVSHQQSAVFVPVLWEQTIAQRPSTAASSSGDRQPATVVSVGDGDTLTLHMGGDNVTTRLACIDTAETSAPMGEEAAARLRQILPRGTTVTTRYVDTDRYNRLVAEVYLGDRSINLQMVREGYAVVYPQYLSGCADTEQAFLSAEAEAQQNRRAFWSQSDPIMPWDWRRGVRRSSGARPTPSGTVSTPVPSSPPVVSPPRPTVPGTTAPSRNSNCDASYPGICIPRNSPDLDCRDVPYRNFVVRQPDPHRFDGNRDGIGCES